MYDPRNYESHLSSREKDLNFSGLSRHYTSVHNCKYHKPKVSSLICCLPIFFIVSEQIGVDIMNNLQRDREVIERARDRVSFQFAVYNLEISLVEI